jgi:hypothetical protein
MLDFIQSHTAGGNLPCGLYVSETKPARMPPMARLPSYFLAFMQSISRIPQA